MGWHTLLLPEACQLFNSPGGQGDGRFCGCFSHYEILISGSKDREQRLENDGSIRTFVVMTWQLILGLTIPSVVLLIAVYLMFKQYFNHQTQTYLLQSRQSREQVVLPIRLQAFERLTLLCERIDIVEMILRLKMPGTSATELQSALLLTVQQEYEHNLTQQLYVSQELWNIMILARNKTMDLISLAAKQLPANATGDEYARVLVEMASKEEKLPSQIAQSAIKTESALWL